MMRRTELNRGTSQLMRSAMKQSSKRKHKIEGHHDQKMLDACPGEYCYLRIPGVCIGGMDTVVPAHSNQARHGKGLSIKAADEYTVPACMACHVAIDQSAQFTKQEKFEFWDKAYAAWEPVRAEKLGARIAA